MSATSNNAEAEGKLIVHVRRRFSNSDKLSIVLGLWGKSEKIEISLTKPKKFTPVLLGMEGS
jgi:hypothetical protein